MSIQFEFDWILQADKTYNLLKFILFNMQDAKTNIWSNKIYVYYHYD